MSITPMTDNLNIIAALDNEPNDVGGLTAEQLKAKFDEAGNKIKKYINESLIPELNAEKLPYMEGSEKSIKEQIDGIVLGEIPDGSITAQKLQPGAFYTQDETFASATKALYGLGADAVPDEVFYKLRSSVQIAGYVFSGSFHESTMPSSAYWQSVTHGDGKFVAVASNNSNKAAYSTNGINWTAVTLPSSASWYSVTYGDGKFVAVAYNSNKAAYSTNGISWTAATLPSSANWYSVTYGDGKFVAVAINTDKAAYSTSLAILADIHGNVIEVGE